jgi:hypothetical protein
MAYHKPLRNDVIELPDNEQISGVKAILKGSVGNEGFSGGAMKRGFA